MPHSRMLSLHLLSMNICSISKPFIHQHTGSALNRTITLLKVIAYLFRVRLVRCQTSRVLKVVPHYCFFCISFQWCPCESFFEGFCLSTNLRHVKWNHVIFYCKCISLHPQCILPNQKIMQGRSV